MNKLNLGIIWKDGNVINHRSLLKVVLNPFLRLTGFQIVSIFEENRFVKYSLTSCPRCSFKSSWQYDATDCIVQKYRRII